MDSRSQCVSTITGIGVVKKAIIKGGFAQYVSWVTKEKIPYPASWDSIKHELTNGSLESFMNFTDKFYKDPKVSYATQKIFKEHIRTIITRINKYTGLAYKNDPTIFSWELANEPQSPSIDWVNETARYIKSLDSNHLVTAGLKRIFMFLIQEWSLVKRIMIFREFIH